MKKVSALLLAALLAMTTLAGCSSSSTETTTETTTTTTTTTETEATETEYEWVPDGDITIRVGSAAGGGLDTYARVFGQGLQSNYDATVIVTNMAGANQTIAAADLNAYDAAPEEIMISSIGAFATAPLFTPDTALDIEDYDFIGSVLCDDQIVYACPGNTGIETFEDLVAYGQENGLVVGSQAPGNAPQAVLTALLGTCDIEFTSIFSDGANIDMVSMVAGDVDICIGYPSVGIQYFEEGTVVPLLCFGDEANTRFEGIEVPTAQSKGIDLVFKSNNFMIAKKGNDTEALAHMYDSFVEWQETDEFIELAESVDYVPYVQYADDLKAELVAARAMFEEIYAEYYAE